MIFFFKYDGSASAEGRIAPKDVYILIVEPVVMLGCMAKGAGGIKVVSQLTLEWGTPLDYLSGSSAIQSVLKSRRGGQRSQHQSDWI